MRTQTIPGTDFPLTVYERTGPPPLKNRAEKKQRLGLLAKIHIAEKQLGWNKGESEMLRRGFKVASLADMTIPQLENCVKLMKHYGWKETFKRARSGSAEHLAALRKRCVETATEMPNGEKRLAGLAEKICGTAQLAWCQNAKKLERLLAALGKIKEIKTGFPGRAGE